MACRNLVAILLVRTSMNLTGALVVIGTVCIANAARLRANPGSLHPQALEVTSADMEVSRLLDTHSLMGSVTTMQRMSATAALEQAVPEWASPMPQCVARVNGTLEKLSKAYSPPHVPSVLIHSCGFPEVSNDVGGSEATCKELMQELGQEFHGERNYYMWCRSLTLASFEVMQKVEEQFEANGTVTALRDECSEHCPYLSKVFEVGFKMSKLFMKAFDMQATMTNPDKLFEMLEIGLRQSNQICDWYNKATCTVKNMHKSCTSLMKASVEGTPMASNPSMVAEKTEKHCQEREPCRKACHGVDSFHTDFVLGQMKLASQMPLPNRSLGVAHCAQIDNLLRCNAYPECTKYLTR